MNTVAVEPLGLRARQKLARRHALIDAAHALVAERGLDAVTVEDICEVAGVSSRTFFNYFETKDDAVLGHGEVDLDPAAVALFVGGGPTGRLLDDVAQLLIAGLRAGEPDHDRVLRGLEIVQREPRLLGRHLTWIERHEQAVRAVVVQRLTAPGVAGAGDEAAVAVRADLAAGVVLMLTHRSLLRWHAAGGTDALAGHVLATVEDLRALVAD